MIYLCWTETWDGCRTVLHAFAQRGDAEAWFDKAGPACEALGAKIWIASLEIEEGAAE